MRIVIEIPQEFEADFLHDRLADVMKPYTSNETCTIISKRSKEMIYMLADALRSATICIDQTELYHEDDRSISGLLEEE